MRLPVLDGTTEEGRKQLTQKSLPIAKSRSWEHYLLALIPNMFETMKAERGIGLAAPQVGQLIRIFITQIDGQKLVFINPKITDCSVDTEEHREGCLSLPGRTFDITRPSRITVAAMDENLRPFGLEATGLLARCIMHEMDHLDGILIEDLAAAQNEAALNIGFPS